MAIDRFKDAVWLNLIQNHYTVVGGAGGIGSCVTFLLGRLNPMHISVFDPDNVDTVNTSNQLYGTEHLGKPKVAAIRDIVKNYTNILIGTRQELLTEEIEMFDIYFSCFDNMKARKVMFEAYIKSYEYYIKLRNGDPDAKLFKPLFIDGRLTAEQFQVYCVHDEDTMERYRKTLFEDHEAAPLACGFKGTTHNSFMIASKMIACYTNFAANESTGSDERTLPFMIENDIFTMLETVELC